MLAYPTLLQIFFVHTYLAANFFVRTYPSVPLIFFFLFFFSLYFSFDLFFFCSFTFVFSYFFFVYFYLFFLLFFFRAHLPCCALKIFFHAHVGYLAVSSCFALTLLCAISFRRLTTL